MVAFDVEMFLVYYSGRLMAGNSHEPICMGLFRSLILDNKLHSHHQEHFIMDFEGASAGEEVEKTQEERNDVL